MGIGQTKARELLAENADVFAVRIGSRLYAYKGKLDEWLLNQIGCQKFDFSEDHEFI